MTYPKLNNETGLAVIIAMAMIFVSSIIASSYLTLVIGESRNSVWQKERVQALFVAEAGVQKGLYYLNNAESRPPEWRDYDGQLLPTPLQKEEELVDGRSYNISLHDSSEAGYAWLPSDTYLIESDATIDRISRDVNRSVACIVAKNGVDFEVPAAVTIVDDADPGENELNSFNSNAWTIDGSDYDGLEPGVPGVLITNTGDSLPGQFPGTRIGRVSGEDGDGVPTSGANAIVETDDVNIDLAGIADHFRENWDENITGSGTIAGRTFGSPEDFDVVYADLSQGGIHFSGNTSGYGLLLLENNTSAAQEFRISGSFDWNGVVVSYGNVDTVLVGGGNKIHIIGGLLIGDGTVDMRGTADIVYSSVNVGKLNGLGTPYQIRSWSEGWGNPLQNQ